MHGQVMSRQAVAAHAREAQRDLKARVNGERHMRPVDNTLTTASAMPPNARMNFELVQNLVDDENFDPTSLADLQNVYSLDGILDGTDRVEISSGGGEVPGLETIEEDIEEEEEIQRNDKRRCVVQTLATLYLCIHHARRRYEDWRTRRTRTQERVNAFEAQMPKMLRAYLRWSARQAESSASVPIPSAPGTRSVETYPIVVVDMHGAYLLILHRMPQPKRIPRVSSCTCGTGGRWRNCSSIDPARLHSVRAALTLRRCHRAGFGVVPHHAYALPSNGNPALREGPV